MQPTIFLIFLPWIALGLKLPFNSIAKPSNIEDSAAAVRPMASFNPAELLDGKMRKAEIYTKAVMELKRLENEPLCHRTATKVLLNNCQDLEEINEENYELHSTRLQRQHVESFALSLAICDLERIKFAIPSSCEPFGSVALGLASEGEQSGLRVSSEQVGQCLEALGRDHTYWITWTSYRDKALLFCRAARIDIDKDQIISLHKRLVKVMAEFVHGAESELEHFRSRMARESHTASSYFEEMKKQASSISSKVQATFDSLSNELKHLQDGLRTSFKSAVVSNREFEELVKNAFQVALDATSKMMATQERAMDIVQVNAQSRTEMILADMENAMADRFNRTFDMFENSLLKREEELRAIFELKYQSLVSSIITQTSLIHNQSKMILENHERLLHSQKSLRHYNETWARYMIPISCAILALITGNYRLAPTFSGNISLLALGSIAGWVVILAREKDWSYEISSIKTVFTSICFLNRTTDSPSFPQLNHTGIILDQQLF
ncbi:hypothetical protein F5884DRAFT_775233 [Xylogone sp. PMI_703]|nr:hypothetical protein F5884DRAFT_775233 [Xylogone sp. PMI_703]